MFQTLKNLVTSNNNVKIPPKEWFEWAVDHETDDINQLNNRENHRIFIYDNLMKGHKDHKFVEGLSRTPAITHPKFNMWKRRQDNLIIPLSKTFIDLKQPENKIRGELYVAPTNLIVFLDKLYENGVLFKRVRINLDIPWRPAYWQEMFNRGDIPGPRSANVWQIGPRFRNNDVWRGSDTTSGKPVSACSGSHLFLETVYATRTLAWMYIGIQDYWTENMYGTVVKSYPSETLTIAAKNGSSYDEIQTIIPRHKLKPYYFHRVTNN